MRNLKKFLALVLAMMMAMSLMVTVNAANTTFSDSDTVTEAFQEDIIVLNGMGVIQGYEDGSFGPQRSVTRGQMAAFIYRMATGDAEDKYVHNYVGYNIFSDVKDTDWFAGYIGYCANAGYIVGYGDGSFRPFNNVTGYQALAMILRAMGYNEPGHNFTGTGWETYTSSTATQRDMLIKVNNTNYKNSLRQIAPRELIAELVFQGLTTAMVQYTPAFGYQTTGMTGGLLGDNLNPDLGWLNYGLTCDTGIIVGNQETGETNTRVSFTRLPSGADVYSYVDATINGSNQWVAAATGNNAINDIFTFDVETGLDRFAHKTTVWFDGRGSSWSQSAAPNDNNLTTYATFDRATLVSAVKHPSGALTVNTPYTSGTLGAAAAGKGFAVSGNTTAYMNQSFNRFIPDGTSTTALNGSNDTAACTTTADTNKDCVYLLISNSVNKSLDVVIAMNIESAAVTGVDNVNAIKTVTVPRKASATDFIVDANELVGASGGFVLEQNQLVGESTKELGQKEIGVNITGTAEKGGTPALPVSALSSNLATGAGYVPARRGATYEDAWYLLKPVTEKTSGKVVAYNTDTGKITLDTGVVLDQSVLYDTVITPYIPQQTSYSNMTYEFYLDPVGKYLGAAPVRDLSFVYGTYMDYSQEVSSSAFKYFLTGVTPEGEKVTVPVENVNGALINTTDILQTPFRDAQASATSVNGIGQGVYTGWVLSGTNAIDNGASWAAYGMNRGATTQPGCENFNNAAQTIDGVTTAAGDVFIGRTATTLGAVKASDASGTDLYFTENTKFVVVSGYGTDSLDAQVYNGISELKGSNTYVNLNMAALSENKNLTVATSNGYQHIETNTSMAYMTYYSVSPFVYAQTGNTSLQADVVILPAAAITESGVNSLYYVGSANPTLINANGWDATQFTMYQDGMAKSVWVDGFVKDFGNAAASGSAQVILDDIANKNSATYCDKFYRLVDSGLTANDGEPIYNVVGGAITPTANAADGVATISVYSSSTYSAQTGTFAQRGTALTTPMRNVANANITNVNLEQKGALAEWPGITDLTTLNYAGSLNGLGYGGATKLNVTAVLDPSNPLIVTQIYICYLQDQT